MSNNPNGKDLPKGIYLRKDGRYEARAVVQGVKIQLYGSNLKQLIKDFESAKKEAKTGLDRKYKNITLNDWFEEWFTKYKLPILKNTNVDSSRSKFYSYYGRILGNKRIIDITNMDIQMVLNTMYQDGRVQSTMRDALGRVRECLEAARANHIISENPCIGIAVPVTMVKKESRVLSQNEQTIFLQAVENSWYKEMFFVMFLTGLRIGELGGLQTSDIDFENKCIHVNRSLFTSYLHGTKTMVFSTPKTYNSYRKIPFMGEVETMLLSQIQKRDQLKNELGSRYRSQGEFADVLFVTTMGSPIIRHIAEKECKKVVRSINAEEHYNAVQENRMANEFQDVHPHAIRHTFCTRCFEYGLEPKVIQKIMGHQHYSTTIDIYTHVMQDQFSDEAKKFKIALQCVDQTSVS